MVVNFISGGGGFVASHLADYLIEKGETVWVSYRWFEEISRIKHLQGNPNFHMIPMDLTDQGSCISAIEKVKPDYIFHLAAQSYVSESFDYPVATMMANGVGTLNLLEAIRKVKEQSVISGYFNGEKTILTKSVYLEINGKHTTKELIPHKFDPIIHICSSSEVYGLVEEKDIPIKETTRFNPSNPYAVSKVAADMWGLLYFTNYNMKVIRTRFFTHTGPRRSMMSAECAFAKQIALIEAGKQEPILKHGNLDSVRTWADVRDAVKGYYLLSRKGKSGEVYNVGGNTTKTIGEMLETLLSLSTRKDIKLEQDPKLLRSYDVTLQIPDISKFKQDTGWSPEIPFEKTMEDLLNWWRANI